MSGELEIMQSSIDGIEIVRLQGEITAVNATLVTAGVADLLKQGRNKLLLDLRTISYISSVGIGALTRSQANVAEVGGRLAVVHAPGMVDRLFKLTHMEKALNLYQDEALALASFSDRQA